MASYSSSKAVSVVAVAAGGGGGGASAAASAAAAVASASACCCGWCPLLVLLLTSGAPTCCCPFPSGRAPWDSEVARRLTARQRESSVPVVVAGGCCRVFESFFLVGVEFSLARNRSLPLSLTLSFLTHLVVHAAALAGRHCSEPPQSLGVEASTRETGAREGATSCDRDSGGHRGHRRRCFVFSFPLSSRPRRSSFAFLTCCSIASFVSSHVFLHTSFIFVFSGGAYLSLLQRFAVRFSGC